MPVSKHARFLFVQTTPILFYYHKLNQARDFKHSFLCCTLATLQMASLLAFVTTFLTQAGCFQGYQTKQEMLCCYKQSFTDLSVQQANNRPCYFLFSLGSPLIMVVFYSASVPAHCSQACSLSSTWVTTTVRREERGRSGQPKGRSLKISRNPPRPTPRLNRAPTLSLTPLNNLLTHYLKRSPTGQAMFELDLGIPAIGS